MGVDRALGGNLRLGAFVGAGASRERIAFDLQKIDATYVFGGVYGRIGLGGRHRELRRLVHQSGSDLRLPHSGEFNHRDAALARALCRRRARWL